MGTRLCMQLHGRPCLVFSRIPESAAEPDFAAETAGVATLLARDRKAVELSEDAFADTEPSLLGAVNQEDLKRREQEQQKESTSEGPAVTETTQAGSGPRSAREAIDQGLARFQQRDYQAAIDLFQQSLELPGNGSFRMSGTLGQKDSALLCLKQVLDNDFEDVGAIRSDPDLMPVRGRELDDLLSQYDNLVARVFKKKKQEPNNDRPWIRW